MFQTMLNSAVSVKKNTQDDCASTNIKTTQVKQQGDYKVLLQNQKCQDRNSEM